MAKSKPQVHSSKVVDTKLGASASSRKPNPPMPKKNYFKGKPKQELISNANFGQTGLTGRS